MNDSKIQWDISEVTALYGFENESKLRYWEKEFPMLKPQRGKRHRIYTQEDLDVIEILYYLVEKKGHKLAAARELYETEKLRRAHVKKLIKELETTKIYLETMRFDAF